jgi:rubrerythrin
LDNRYKKNYGMSVIDNLMDIKEYGIRQFVRNQNEKWLCPECGEIVCIHKPECPSCGRTWRKQCRNEREGSIGKRGSG